MNNNDYDDDDDNDDDNIYCLDCNYSEECDNLKQSSLVDSKKEADKLNNAKKYIKKNIPASLKRQVWSHWIGKFVAVASCLCCGISEIEKNNFSCGHIIAESKGGKLEIANLKPICTSCNSSIGTNNMDEFIKMYGLNKYKHQYQQLCNNKNDVDIGAGVDVGVDADIHPDAGQKHECIIISAYYCKKCKYHTPKMTHFTRHLKSNKHAEVTGKTYDENIDVKQFEQKMYECTECNDIYPSKYLIDKHKKTCCSETLPLQNNILKENHNLKQELNSLKDNLINKLMNDVNDLKKDVNDFRKDLKQKDKTRHMEVVKALDVAKTNNETVNSTLATTMTLLNLTKRKKK